MYGDCRLITGMPFFKPLRTFSQKNPITELRSLSNSLFHCANQGELSFLFLCAAPLFSKLYLSLRFLIQLSRAISSLAHGTNSDTNYCPRTQERSCELVLTNTPRLDSQYAVTAFAPDSMEPALQHYKIYQIN